MRDFLRYNLTTCFTVRTKPKTALFRVPVCCILVSLLTCNAPLFAQERQISFDTNGEVMEIASGSVYESVWRDDAEPFDRLLAFTSDTSTVLLESYRRSNSVVLRSRKSVTMEQFLLRRVRVDELALAAMNQQEGRLSEKELEDLRSTFTLDQTGFSSIHGLIASYLTESASMSFIVTGGSYFAISALSDNMSLTRANVEAAKYGHLTGLLQGYYAGMTIFDIEKEEGAKETQTKGMLALTSVGGIARATLSYRGITGSGGDPATYYLKLTAERHSLAWGTGAILLALGDDTNPRVVFGTALAVSLSSRFWSDPLFGFSNRRMSWGDALLADEFMSPWYLTLLATGVTAEFEDARSWGALFAGGGVAGYMLGLSFNEGRMRELGTVNRARLLTYGGLLLGLGLNIAFEPSAKGSLWIFASSTWLGYFIGGRFHSSEPSSAWDIQLIPENLVLGSMLRNPPRIGFPAPRSLPVASLSFRL